MDLTSRIKTEIFVSQLDNFIECKSNESFKNWDKIPSIKDSSTIRG